MLAALVLAGQNHIWIGNLNLNFKIQGFVPRISHRAAAGSQCATSKNAQAGEIIYIRLRDSYHISHVLVYGGVKTMDGIEVGRTDYEYQFKSTTILLSCF